jgi:protein SCO1/2
MTTKRTKRTKGRAKTGGPFDWRLALLLVGAAVISLGGRWMLAGGGQEAPPVGGPFALVTQDGGPMTDQDLLGHHALVYFGYTYCPDICPTTLQAVADALDMVPPAVERAILPVMITVDPDRDSPEKMGDYVSLFHPRMVGLTGDRAHVQQAMESYGIVSERVENTPNGYDMDHVALLFLMGPDGKLESFFTPDVTAADLARRLEEVIGPQVAPLSRAPLSRD